MSERIDLTWLDGSAMQEETMENICDDLDYIEQLVAELKKMYAREDELLDALRLVRDDLDVFVDKFANDASQ